MVLQRLPNLEIYNSQFTANFGEWALGFCGGVYVKDNPGRVHQGDRPLEGVASLDLSNRCIHSLINKVRTLSICNSDMQRKKGKARFLFGFCMCSLQ